MAGLNYILLMAAASASAPQPGDLKVYKDWAVGCDNARVCQMVSLFPENNPAGDEGLVVITRTAERKDRLKVKILLNGTGVDRYRMLIDGRLVDTGPVVKGDDPIEIVGADAHKVVAALIKGNNLKLVGPNGVTLSTVSLAGTAASMRYMDDQQQRARTKTALVAKGSRRFVPPPNIVPTIMISASTPSTQAPETGDIVALAEGSECNNERFGLAEDQTFPLGQKDKTQRALVLISCGAGAYNFVSAAYIGENTGEGTGWSFKPASFDYKQELGELDKAPLLVNASWNGEDQVLSTYNKGRGLGDCGNAESYVWDGEQFRLIAASAMDECRGAYEWVPLWQARREKVKN